jgi:hypothetical protein
MLKCQSCDQPATHHVTEIVAGQPVEYHVCKTHLPDLDRLPSFSRPNKYIESFGPFWEDPKLRDALRDPTALQEMAAHVLPALCLALLHPRPEVRITAAFRLMQFGSNARSAVGALRDALRDPDEHVAKAARIALEYIEMGDAPPYS